MKKVSGFDRFIFGEFALLGSGGFLKNLFNNKQTLMRTSVLISTLVLASVGFIAPAQAAEKSVEQISAPVTISVIGDIDVLGGTIVPVANLKKVGVSAVNSNSAMSQGIVAQAFAAASYSEYSIMTEWKDNTTLTVPMRYGKASWGYRHVVDTHNVTTNVSRTATKYPKYRTVESASSIVYKTPVYELTCGVINCTIKSQVMVKAVVNPQILGDGHRKGIISTYCENMFQCPDWVKNAVNAN